MRNERFCQPISSQELAGQLAPWLTRYFRRTVIDPSTNQLKTVSTPVVLGLKSEMTKYEAREKLELEIKRLTGQIAEDGVVRNRSVTFDWFVQNRYLGIGGGKKSSYQSERQQGQQQASIGRIRRGKQQRHKQRNPVRSRSEEWFWNLRQNCDKVEEGESF
jgi:hypothetical protein